MDPRLAALRNMAITVCGLIALFTPLALWMAWSKTGFYAVIAIGCSAVLIVFFLITLSPDDDF